MSMLTMVRCILKIDVIPETRAELDSVRKESIPKFEMVLGFYFDSAQCTGRNDKSN